jgi:hypothetical protein
MFAETREIVAVERLDHETFRSCHAESRPILVRGAALGSKAFATWSPEYFSSLFGDRQVSIFVKDLDAADYAHNNARKEMMEFRRAAALIRQDTLAGRRHYYLQNKYIPEEFPELEPDLEVPRWIDRPDLLTKFNLWFGGAGNVTPLHFDPDNNFLVQIRGKKHLTLFAPSEFHLLYPDMYGRHAFISRVDMVQPDYAERFPLVRQAKALEGMLEPGDVLYLPPFWWHLVRSLEESISVNFWWKAHIRQLDCPAAVFYVPEAFDAGVLLAELGKFDQRGFAGPLEVARFYLDQGYAWVAVLVAVAAAEAHLDALATGAAPAGGGPRRLPELSAALAAAGAAAALGAGELERWFTLVGRARAKDEGLDREEVAAMLDEVDRRLAFPV